MLNVETLIDNLDYTFSVISVSEAWAPKMKNRVPPMMQNYQTYYDIQVKTTKSGCRFYVKKQIKYKPRKQLDLEYFDENNEL